MIKKALLDRLSKKIVPSGEPIGYLHAQTVGIVALHSFASEITHLVKKLEEEGKSPRMVLFEPSPIKNETYPKHTFIPKEITMSGSILSDEVVYFTKQTYDFLLCLDPSGSPFIKYIVSKTSARHRVGLFHANFKAHLDMMIMPQENENAVAELMKYVKMIRHD